MTKSTPIGVPTKEAAAMFRISQKLFEELVDAGAIPRPKRIGTRTHYVERWSVRELEDVVAGRAPTREFKL